VAGLTGMTVTPVTTQEAQGVELVILKTPGPISDETVQRLNSTWATCVSGTSLAGVRTVVLTDGMQAEFVRTR
jgi:hypothetical protein